MNQPTLSPIERAIRNAMTFHWLGTCDGYMHAILATQYAAHLRCPVCEVDTKEDTSAEWLEWVAEHYANVIALWSDDQ